MQKNTKRVLLTFLGVILLAGGIVFGVLATQSKVIFNQKAAPTTAEKIAEIAKNIGENKIQSNITYTSPSLGYSLDFNKNYWSPSIGTDLNFRDLHSLSFNLNTSKEVVKVDFQTFEAVDLAKKITAGKSISPKGDNLDALANGIAISDPPISKLRVRRNGRDFYKLTYKDSFLNQHTTYYKYITIGDNNYYSFTAKYPHFGNGSNMAEEFIDSFSFLPARQDIKGASTTSMPSSALSESKIVELTKPSVVSIAHIYCNDIKIRDTGGLHYLKSSYKYCDGMLGSGFLIGENGLIATNGHVVVQFPDSSLIRALANQNPYSQEFFVDLIRELTFIQKGQEISEDNAKTLLKQASSDPTYFEAFVTLVYKMIHENVITLTPNSEKHFVKLANEPMLIDSSKVYTDFLSVITPSATIKEAKLISFDYPNELSVANVIGGKKETGSDVAIIQITDTGKWIFPSLTLGTSDGLKEGSDVIVIGYPGLVSGGKDSLISQKSSATPTVTKGIVSAVKNDQFGLKLIQVDASIDHGNSGGPAFDNQGRVIGIATYGIAGQNGNYNFLRDVEDLKKLASKNSLEASPSTTYIEWGEGLEYFWREHYKQAVVPFEKVETNYPIHPLASNYSSDSKEAIKKGQDKSDFLFLLKSDRDTQVTFASIIFALATILFTIYLIAKRAKDTTKPHSVSNLAISDNVQPTTWSGASQSIGPVLLPNSPSTNTPTSAIQQTQQQTSKSTV